MFESDKNILKLVELLKLQKRILTTKEFSESIGMLNSTISRVPQGKCHFTVEQILLICKKYNVNANFIFGFDDVVFRDKSNKKLSDYSFNFNDLSGI
jgi:transcriptional regulator with XRE-family HTH domain